MFDYNNTRPKDFLLARQGQDYSVRSLYKSVCKVLESHTSESILNRLPARPGDFGLVQLDLSDTFVGAVGVQALLPSIAACKSLKALILANNGIPDKAASLLCKALENTPTLIVLDLTGNPVGGKTAKELVSLTERSPNLAVLKLARTEIPAPRQRHLQWLVRQHVQEMDLPVVLRDLREQALEQQEDRMEESQPLARKQSQMSRTGSTRRGSTSQAVQEPSGPPITRFISEDVLTLLGQVEREAEKWAYRGAEFYFSMDNNQQGTLQPSEWAEGMKELDLAITRNMTPGEAESLLDAAFHFVSDGRKLMTIQDLMNKLEFIDKHLPDDYLTNIVGRIFDSHEHIEAVFQDLDKNSDNELSLEELELGLEKLKCGGPLGFLDLCRRSWVAKKIFESIDTSRDGSIEFTEFKARFAASQKEAGVQWWMSKLKMRSLAEAHAGEQDNIQSHIDAMSKRFREKGIATEAVGKKEDAQREELRRTMDQNPPGESSTGGEITSNIPYSYSTRRASRISLGLLGAILPPSLRATTISFRDPSGSLSPSPQHPTNALSPAGCLSPAALFDDDEDFTGEMEVRAEAQAVLQEAFQDVVLMGGRKRVTLAPSFG